MHGQAAAMTENNEARIPEMEFVKRLFSHARAGEVDSGWQLLRRQLPLQPRSLDVCYAACYLAYQRADYDEAERWGAEYLACHAALSDDAPCSGTRGQLHEVLNMLACTARDRGHCELALDFIDRAIEATPDYSLSYINGAIVSSRCGKSGRANRYVSDGLARCGGTKELRMLQRGELRERTISLCMIVKDEEEMLPGALESVKDVVDEIIVVDTGSADHTVQIAKSFGARVYHHAWEQDFSKARNQSIAYATGDWIFVLDADERLAGASLPLLRRLAQTCRQDCVSFSVYNVNLDNEQVSFLPSVRMFRNGQGYQYTGIVHNQLDTPSGTEVVRAPVRIDHFGYTPSIVMQRRKFERTASLLTRQLDANPDDAFAHFNMAQLMRNSEALDRYHVDIVKHARRVTELLEPGDTDHGHILLMAYHQLASSLLGMGHLDEAALACRRALALKPDYIDSLMTLGQVLVQQQRFSEARVAFLRYLEIREEYDESDESTGFIILHLENEHQAYHGLGLTAEALGDPSQAITWYCKVLRAQGDYLDTRVRLERLCGHRTDRMGPGAARGVQTLALTG